MSGNKDQSEHGELGPKIVESGPVQMKAILGGILNNGGAEELPTKHSTGTDIHGIVEDGLRQRERSSPNVNYRVPTKEGDADAGDPLSSSRIELAIIMSADDGRVMMRVGPATFQFDINEAAQLGQGMLIACGQLRERLNQIHNP